MAGKVMVKAGMRTMSCFQSTSARHQQRKCTGQHLHASSKEPLQRRSFAASSTEKQDAETRLLEEDMQRLQARQPEKLREYSSGLGPPVQETSSSGAKELLDKLLVADFFFVCIALAWLAGGVLEKSALNSTALLDSWFPLWPALFQPAIGVLMLGAVGCNFVVSRYLCLRISKQK